MPYDKIKTKELNKRRSLIMLNCDCSAKQNDTAVNSNHFFLFNEVRKDSLLIKHNKTVNQGFIQNLIMTNCDYYAKQNDTVVYSNHSLKKKHQGKDPILSTTQQCPFN